MTGLLLVAASGLATEVLAVARALGTHSSFVLLDDDPARWGTRLDDVAVAGGLTAHEVYPDHELVVCAGQGRVRRALVRRLERQGVTEERFARVVHPSVDVPPGCTVGAGSILLTQAALTADVTLGRHVVVMPHVSLTHGVRVDDYATLCAGAILGGGVRVGTCAYLGMGSSVREGVTVGAGATLGMGAVLLESTPADETWVGVPARRLARSTRRDPEPAPRTSRERSLR